MPELLYEQEGGMMEPSSKDSGGGGPTIGTTTIDMKIQLVADDSLPSYLIPDLTCDVGSTPIPASKVKVTLTGDSLRKETPAPKDFKCEITSNFLTKDEKSAITIETYYVDSSDSSLPLLGTNKIYFDESLLSYYDSIGLKKSDNPFLATATPTDSGATYTFEFDFHTIIGYIKKLPSYKQIQDMFMFVNNIPGMGMGVTKTTLINISAGGFLNLKFSGVPFNNSNITTNSKLTLNIETTNGPIPTGCNLKNLFGSSDILTKNLHNVLELLDYKDFDFTNMAKAQVSQQVSQQVTPPVVDSAAAKAAKAAADLATAEAEHKVATAAAEVAATKATETKTNAKPVIDKAVGEIKTKMGLMLPDDKAKIPPAVKTFIDASQALATAKAGTDADAIAREEAAFKAAYIDPNLKKAIDAGLATGSSLPSSVQDVLKDAKTIQEQHDKMDTADAEVVKSKAVVDATREKAAKAWDADQAATNAATKLNTRTGTEAAAGSAIKVVNTNNTQAASTTSTELENKLKKSIAAQSQKLDDVIAQLKALQLSQTNTGSTSVAGFGNVIVRAPGDSDACGNGGISMESRDGSLIFKVPYDKIISEIAPNMRSAMAQRALAKKAANSDAANSDAAISVSVDPNAAAAAAAGNATKPVSAADPNAAKPVITIPVSAAGAALNPVVVAAGVAATLDTAETAALQTAKDGLDAQQKRLTDAKIATTLAEINALYTAIKTAEAAVGALPIIADDSAKSTALNDAKTKITLLAGLVTTATKAVDEAIVAAQIQALTEKLQKEATDVLTAAKTSYGTTQPPIDFTNEDGLIKTATAEIGKAAAADAAGKPAAITTASAAVDAAIVAAKKADVAVKAAVLAATGSGKPHDKTFDEYTQLYDEYDAQKKLLEEKIDEFNSLKSSYNPGQAGGGKPLTYSQSGGEVPKDFSNDVRIMSTTIQDLFKNIFTTTDYQSRKLFYYRVNFDISDGNEYSNNPSAGKTELPGATKTEKDFVLWCARSDDGANPQYASVNIQSYEEFQQGNSQLEKISIQPYNVNLSFYDVNKKKLIDGSITDADDKTFFSDTFLKLVYYLSLMCSSRSKQIVMIGSNLHDTNNITSIPALSPLSTSRATYRDEPYTKFVNDYLVVSKTNTSSPEISLKSDESDKPAMVDIIATQSQNIITESLIPNLLPKIGKDKPEEPEELSTSLSEAVIAAFTDGKTAVTRTQAFIDQQNSSLTGNIIYPLRTKITTEADYTASSVEETKKDISSLEGLIQAYKHTIDIIEKCIVRIQELNPVAVIEQCINTIKNIMTKLVVYLTALQADNTKENREELKLLIDDSIKAASKAVSAASASKIDASVSTSVNDIVAKLKEIIANNADNKKAIITSIPMADLIERIKALKTALEPKLSQAGGSKQSKSSSSKSSSKSKSKSKNKTKKNHHSKSKSNKNKTPKIIMNE